jgi:hypothetical protein
MEGADIALRGRLYERLRRFVREVKVEAARRRMSLLLEVQVLSERQLPAQNSRIVSPQINRLWSSRPDSIAFLWGRVEPGNTPNEGYPTGTIYIGVAPIESLLAAQIRPAVFGPVPGQIIGNVEDLDAYEIIVGYALLRRIWRERRYDLMEPIVEVLKRHMLAAQQGGSLGSWEGCFVAIQNATAAILRARRPSPTDNPSAAPALPDPIDCS